MVFGELIKQIGWLVWISVWISPDWVMQMITYPLRVSMFSSIIALISCIAISCIDFLHWRSERCNLFPDGKPFPHSFVGASVSSDGLVTFVPGGGRAALGVPSSPPLFRPQLGSCRCFFEAAS